MKINQNTFKKELWVFTIFISFQFSIPVFAASSSSSIPKKTDSDRTSTVSAFDPNMAKWDISWPGRISQYDLVYKSPPIDPMQGIPLGNGDVGALFWCEDSKIIIAVNKCDLWDDAKPDSFDNWKNEKYDHYTTLRHASRIIIDFKFPIFNALYLSDFEARLSLADASLNIDATCPFGRVGMKAFIDHRSGVLMYEFDSNLNENTPVEVAIERFGSRSFSSWFGHINRDPTIGLSGTETVADSSGTFLTQPLSSGTFAVGGTVVKDSSLIVNYSKEHSRRVLITLCGNRHKKAQLVFAVISPIVGDPVFEVKKKLSAATREGLQELRRSHADAWKFIWNRSFMDYGDDYLNNLWHLTMYYANASQGGKYPGRFVNGLWGWSRDVQNWNFYFHWNQQQLYWPLNAAGFHELINPYLDFRFNSLPHAKKDAEGLLKAKGAFISDVTNRNGYNSPGQADNHTPVAEIALDFWRQYQYTGDKKFLQEKALPFILEAGRFFESLLVKENDGMYHSKEGTGYEGWIKLKDCLTDLVYARVLFSIALEALKVTDMDIPEVKKWQEIKDHLAPLPIVKAEKKLIIGDEKNYTLNRGIFKGEVSPTNEIFAAGWGIEENNWLTVYYPVDDTTFYGLKAQDGIFPSVPSSPVFPSGLIGLEQKKDVIFNQMTATALLYGSEITGWDPVPIVLARLGLTTYLASDLDRFPGRWQVYCNGWGHWGLEHNVEGKDYHQIYKDANCFFRTYEVQDMASDEKLPLRMWPFRYTCMESMSVLATAMNESLLQSYEGIIRIAPAFPESKTGRFTLHAVGGFVVSSEIKSGKVQWICIKSLQGNPCKLELPWSNSIVQSNLKKGSRAISGNTMEINTKADEKIMILPEGQSLKSWSVISEKPLPNENVKYHSSGKTQLGIPRMF